MLMQQDAELLGAYLSRWLQRDIEAGSVRKAEIKINVGAKMRRKNENVVIPEMIEAGAEIIWSAFSDVMPPGGKALLQAVAIWNAVGTPMASTAFVSALHRSKYGCNMA
jgi:hypothetical protein